jgi:plasmid stabilization system protein ParE
MPLARLHLREATAWWAANRTGSREALAAAVRRALAQIADHPGIGRPATEIRREGVRRYYVPRVHYYLYYRITESLSEVLAFWHASRGTPPPI